MLFLYKMQLPPEINLQVLLNLDYPSLLSVCRLNVSTNLMCRDDYLWQLKLQQDFPGLAQYKPAQLSWRQQYDSLYFLPSMTEAIRHGRLDQIILLHRQQVQPTMQDLLLAAETGQVDVLDWLAAHGQLPSPGAYYYAAVQQHFNVLEWLWEHGIPIPEEIQVNGIWYPILDALILAMKQDVVPVLLWFEQHGQEIDDELYAAAAETESIPLLNWLRYDRHLYPGESAVIIAAGDGKLDVLNWLYQHGAPITEDAGREAAANGHLEVLKWLRRHGVEPTIEWARIAAIYEQSEILNWLERSMRPLEFPTLHITRFDS